MSETVSQSSPINNPLTKCPSWCITDHTRDLEDPEPCWSEMQKIAMSTVEADPYAGPALIGSYLEAGPEGTTIVRVQADDLIGMTVSEARSFATDLLALIESAN